MTQEPGKPSPDPVPPSSRTDLRLSDTAGDRLVTIIAWVVGLVLITALAATVAAGFWWLQKTRFDMKPVEVVREIETVQTTLPPPVEVRNERGDLIVSPRWISAPRPQFPALARKIGVEEGQVRLECVIGVDGRVEACVVLEEAPAGAGFAESAIKAAKAARLSPRTVNGEATKGKIQFPTRFGTERDPVSPFQP